MTKMIPLTQGKFAVVDDQDYERINKHKWCYSGGYAIRVTSLKRDGEVKTILMHREIMNTPDGMETDHEDGNGLRNIRKNLRVCTKQENDRNQRTQVNSKSGFKGVSWYERDGKWRAQIGNGKKKEFLGCFEDPEDAARAYDDAARKLYGRFAKLNFAV